MENIVEFAILNLSDMSPGPRNPETLARYIQQNPTCITYLHSQDPMMVLSYTAPEEPKATRPSTAQLDTNVPFYVSLEDLELDFNEGVLEGRLFAAAGGCDLGDGHEGTMTFRLDHANKKMVPLVT